MPENLSRPLPLGSVRVKDPFWMREMDLIRTAVIPYQWEALNDRVPGAAPSWWVHNMQAAARAVQIKKTGGEYVPAQRDFNIVVQPREGEAPLPDAFYGWVFQDSDGYKWLEAVAYQLLIRPDAALQQKAQQAVDMICAAQEEDGYLDTFYTLTGRERAFTYLKDHHELYCFGHLAEAAVAWHQATGRDDLLNAAARFAQCIARRFGPGKERGCPGHEIAEMALVRLYEETGDRQYLNLCNFFLDVRGTDPSTFALEENRRRREQGQNELPVTAERYVYYQAHRPVRQMDEAVGHAVRQMYLCSGMADAARLTGDQEMAAACRRLWRSTVREKMYVTGGVGGTHVGEALSRPFDLPADTAYSETCAAVGLAFFARRMLEMELDSQYADVMERALYNTVLAGMALDGRSFFYVNPLEVDPDACDTDQRLSHVKPERQKWFGCACCPPNIARIVSSLGAYIAGTGPEGLQVHLYVGSEITAPMPGGEITVRIDADLWKDGRVTLTVMRGEGDGEIALRLPDWAAGYTLSADGRAARVEKGYLHVAGPWRAGDEMTVDFAMPVRAVAASPLVRENVHQVCFTRGPLVFCAEERDNPAPLHLLRACPDRAEEAVVSQREIAGVTVPVITVPGRRVTPPGDAPLYAPWQAEETQEIPIVLVPYFAWNNRGRGQMRVWLAD